MQRQSLSFGQWVCIVIVAGVVAALSAAAVVALAPSNGRSFPLPPDILPPSHHQPPEAMRAVAMTQARALYDAVQLYVLRTGELPNALSALVHGPMQWDGRWEPLMPHIPLDPWGTPYEYEILDADAHEFRIISYGADGLPGGDGPNADIIFPAPIESEPR